MAAWLNPDRLLAWLPALAAWACYAPLGAKYATTAACVLACGARLAGPSAAPRAWPPASAAALALWLLLALSTTWSPVPLHRAAGVLGQYALPLLLLVVARACPASSARRALLHFVLASACASMVFVLASAGVLPPSAWAWHTSVDAEGNQRIATSVLLALGSTLALWLATTALPWRERLAWTVLALLCAAGLALQDRRSGMLLLPLLLLLWAWVRERRWSRRLLAVAAVLALAAGTAWLSDGVRQRFDEGVRELRLYRGDDLEATSWGQRLRMWQLTGAMVAERPLAGHGVASWRQRWTERVTPGTALAAHSTPHNEYLLLAQQAGVLAPLLWILWLAAGARTALRAGAVGMPALLALVALAWTGLFNAVLRDAKFALPLLLLAALGAAAAQAGTAPRPAAQR